MPFRIFKTGERGKKGASAKEQVAFILPGFKPTNQQEIERAASLVEQGHQLAKEEKYDEAELCFYDLFKIHPELTPVWVDFALGEYAGGFEDKLLHAYTQGGLQDLDEILRIHPRCSRAFLWKGVKLDKIRRFDEALLCYKKAIEINSDSILLLWNMALIEIDVYRNYSKAMEILDALLRINPQDVLAMLMQGQILSNQNKSLEAMALYDKALDIDPKNPFVLCDKGTEYEKLGKLNEALDCFNKSLAIDPNHYFALTNKGVILQAKGDYDLALDCYDKALKISSTYANAVYNKSRLKAVTGKTEESLELLKKAVQLDPNCKERANKAPEFQSLRNDQRIKHILS